MHVACQLAGQFYFDLASKLQIVAGRRIKLRRAVGVQLTEATNRNHGGATTGRQPMRFAPQNRPIFAAKSRLLRA
jgi:hypothetical protein